MKQEMTIMSSKGQVVVPAKIRKKLHLQEGTHFAVYADEEGILLVPVELDLEMTPALKEWREAVKKAGITPKDLERIIAEVRAEAKAKKES